MSDPITHSPLIGRFYRMSSPWSDTDLIGTLQAKDLCFEEERGVGRKVYNSFCTSFAPHTGDLISESAPLGYDAGEPLCRAWIRQETRTVKRAEVKVRVAERGLAQWGLGYDELPRHSRKELEEQVSDELMAEAKPSVRVLPVVLSDEWAWIGSKDLSFATLLYPVTGVVHQDALVWDRGDVLQWNALSSAALAAYFEAEDDKLDADCRLLEVSVRGKGFSFKLSDVSHKEALRQAYQERGGEVQRLSFAVQHDGDDVWVVVDAHGVVQATPLISKGGLFSERLARRFSDARTCGMRIGEVLSDAFRKHTGTGIGSLE